MSLKATNWVWSLTEFEDTKINKATLKLALLKHADHAHDDGTHTWQVVDTIAEYALCSRSTAQRANSYFLDEGYMREGDQSVIPDKYKGKKNKPVAFELAMDEETRLRWKAEAAAGSNPLREAARAAGSKGGVASAQARRGVSVTPHGLVSTADDAPSSRGVTVTPHLDDTRGVTEHVDGVSGETGRGVTGDTQTIHEPPNPSGTTLFPAALSSSSAVPAKTTDSPVGSSKKGTRIPEHFEPTPDMLEWARENTPLVGRVEHEKFVDFWRAKPGKDGVKLDWVATWRNWFRSAQQRLETSAATPRRGYDDRARWGEDTTPDAELSDEEVDAIFNGTRTRPGGREAGTA